MEPMPRAEGLDVHGLGGPQVDAQRYDADALRRDARIREVGCGRRRWAQHAAGTAGGRQPRLEHASAPGREVVGVVPPRQVVDGGDQGRPGGGHRSTGGMDEVGIPARSIDTRATQADP